MKKKVYLISGLGADHSVFAKLDLSFCEPVFLDWIQPLKDDTLRSYALRMAEKIEEPNATIIGLSMGGMMASEIVAAHPGMRAVIVSSNRTANEFPPYNRFMIRYIPVYQLSTRWILRLIFPFHSWVLGAESDSDRERLRGVIERIDLDFVKWCIAAIGNWDRRTPATNVLHIHGTADRLLPYRYVKPDYTIRGAGHLMILNRAGEISELLRKLV